MDPHIFSDFIHNEDVFVPSLIAGSIVICLVVKSFTTMVAKVARERTRREIAAYIAEGSMTPEQGERLMAANKRDRACY